MDLIMQRMCQLLAYPLFFGTKAVSQLNYAPQLFRPRTPAPLECNIEAFGAAGSLLAVQLAPIELIQ